MSRSGVRSRGNSSRACPPLRPEPYPAPSCPGRTGRGRSTVQPGPPAPMRGWTLLGEQVTLRLHVEAVDPVTDGEGARNRGGAPGSPRVARGRVGQRACEAAPPGAAPKAHRRHARPGRRRSSGRACRKRKRVVIPIVSRRAFRSRARSYALPARRESALSATQRHTARNGCVRDEGEGSVAVTT